MWTVVEISGKISLEERELERHCNLGQLIERRTISTGKPTVSLHPGVAKVMKTSSESKSVRVILDR